MSEEMTHVFYYYDRKVVGLMMEKYGLTPMEALRRFLFSKTYGMLRDPRLEMWEFSPFGIFDMWEAEQVTGDPRNSVYIRED